MNPFSNLQSLLKKTSAVTLFLFAFTLSGLGPLAAQSSRVAEAGKPVLHQPAAPGGGDYDTWKQSQVSAVEHPPRKAPFQNRNLTVDNQGEVKIGGCSDPFIPIDGTYTEVPRNDDGSLGPIPLDFTFGFSLCGSGYTSCYINTNGNITFDGSLSQYSADGFPIDIPMVAPFWADVDTRNPNCGQIYYKREDHHLIVTWDQVGYYGENCDKVNTFQVIISDGQSPLLPAGTNVSIRYGDMQWTTGDASDGISGFGGTPATVGVNSGDGVAYFQEGRFNQDNSSYDGPLGAADGVHYLDGRCYAYDILANADADGDGYAGCDGDCDDNNPNVYPGAPEDCNDGVDNNCNGLIDELADYDFDGYVGVDCAGNIVDCNDNDPNIYPGAPEICDGADNNCDGILPLNETDHDGDGYPACNDCNDTNASVFPGAEEICDGLDNDCDGFVDEELIFYYYADNDGDGYGDPDTEQYTCAPPSGYILDGTDCNDADASVFPGAQEIIGNNIDDNCDGFVDFLPYCTPNIYYPCYTYITNVTLQDINNSSDCSSSGYSDFSNLSANLAAGNSYSISVAGTYSYYQYASVYIDWNQDGDFSDNGEQLVYGLWLYYGGPASSSFTVPSNAAGAYTMRVVVSYYYNYDPCNFSYGEAEDYTIQVGSPCPDADGDGFADAACGGTDCDDNNPAINPGATESCDGIDNNCDGAIDEGFANTDGDALADCIDPDDDNDGCLDEDDPNPLVASADSDGDGDADDCDICPNDPDNDIDGDGVCGDIDNCPATANADQKDTDNDGDGDACDEDDDNDGCLDGEDAYPLIASSDSDGDGNADDCDICPFDPDDDSDGDGVCGDVDNCPADANPAQGNADGDSFGDACDICPFDPDNDADGDGVCGDVDNCPTDANPNQADFDLDGIGDACDPEVCFNFVADALQSYVDGLSISSSIKRAINRRLSLAVTKFCDYNRVSSVVADLEYVVSYVSYQSGGSIPTGGADHIITQVNGLIGALNNGTAVCCTPPIPRPANPGQITAADALQLQANPNPFRDEVAIRFSLPQAGPATLEVFNLNGQRVAALHSGYLDAGYQDFRWNGAHEGGQQLSSGIYLVRLQTQDGMLTQKVSLVR